MTPNELDQLEARAKAHFHFSFTGNQMLKVITELRATRRALVEAKRANRCPNDGRPLIFDDPNSGHCGICHFAFGGFPDWNYDPLPLSEARKELETK